MPSMNVRSLAGSLYSDSIYGRTSFGAPVTRRDNVFSVSLPEYNLGMAGLMGTERDLYDRAQRYLARYDALKSNIARIMSETARTTLAKMLGSAKDAGRRILGWSISRGAPEYYAAEVRGYLARAQGAPYSPQAPNYAVFLKGRRPANRVQGLEDAVKGLEPQVEEHMKIHGVLPPDRTAEYEANLRKLQAQIDELRAKGAATPATPDTPVVTDQQGKDDGADKKTDQKATQDWVMPTILGGAAILGIGALVYYLRK